DQGFERARQEAGLVPATALLFAFAEPQERAEVELARDGRERALAHQIGAPAGQLAFARVRILAPEQCGGGEPEDGVAEELHPLVVAAREIGALVDERAMRERVAQELEVLEVVADAFLQPGKWSRHHHARASYLARSPRGQSSGTFAKPVLS